MKIIIRSNTKNYYELVNYKGIKCWKALGMRLYPMQDCWYDLEEDLSLRQDFGEGSDPQVFREYFDSDLEFLNENNYQD